jgi:hypothetical protein
MKKSLVVMMVLAFGGLMAQALDVRKERLLALQSFAATPDYASFLATVSPNSEPMQLKLEGEVAFYVFAKDGVSMHDKHQPYPFFKYDMAQWKLTGTEGKWIISLMGKTGNRHTIVMVRKNGVWSTTKYTP